MEASVLFLSNKVTLATFFKNGSPLEMDTNHQSFKIVETTMTIYSVSDGGNNKCNFDEGAESELKVEGSCHAVMKKNIIVVSNAIPSQ